MNSSDVLGEDRGDADGTLTTTVTDRTAKRETDEERPFIFDNRYRIQIQIARDDNIGR